MRRLPTTIWFIILTIAIAFLIGAPALITSRLKPDEVQPWLFWIGAIVLEAANLAAALLGLYGSQPKAQPAYKPPRPPRPHKLPKPGPLPPGFRLPFTRNTFFTGRTEPLKQLARTLLHHQGPATLVTQSIQGMGGVGKTQLAVEFAFRYGRFFHGVHWLNCRDPHAINAEVAACGAAMQLPNWPDEEPAQVDCTINFWQNDGPRLLILDNLEDVAAARHWLSRLGAGPLRLLLTARRTDWPETVGLDPLPLDLFTVTESRDFLRQYLPQAPQSDLDALADRLGRLPLALELAGRYLARSPSLSLADYTHRLDSVLADPAMTGWRTDLPNATGHDLDLVATFAVTWDQITDDSARQLFLMAGYCAPNQPIPRPLLQAAAGLEAELFDHALGTLTGLGLLQSPDPAADPLIHPLLAEYAQIQAEAPQALPPLADAVATLSRRAGKTGLPTRFAPVRSHLQRVAMAAEARSLKRAGTLWSNLCVHLQDIADFDTARGVCRHALSICQARFGPRHPEVATALSNLGSLQHKVGDLTAARTTHERALAIEVAAFGPDHPRVAIVVSNLGAVLHDQGNLATARDAFERALTIEKATLGPEHPNVALRLNNLGGVLHTLGDLTAARGAYERAAAIWEVHLGPEHPQVGVAISNAGSVAHDFGDLPAARDAYERALAIDETAFGLSHPDVARDLNNLGGVLLDLGNVEAARQALEQALAIDEAAFGPDHPNVAVHLLNLGGVSHEEGDLVAAQEAYERALAIDEAAFGPEHPRVARDLNNLGGALRGQGNEIAARQAYERALAITEDALGRDHPDVARTLNNLGLLLQYQGDLPAARQAFERALAVNECVFGPGHPNVARDLINLGGVLRDEGNRAAARDAFRRALTIDEVALGPRHPDVARDLGNLGSVLRELRELAAARDAHERALAINEGTLGPNHPTVSRDLNNLGVVLLQMDLLPAARDAFQRALTILQEHPSLDEHHNIANVLVNLGNVLKDQGDLAEARKAYDHALAILEEHVGPDHPNTRIAHANFDSLPTTGSPIPKD